MWTAAVTGIIGSTRLKLVLAALALLSAGAGAMYWWGHQAGEHDAQMECLASYAEQLEESVGRLRRVHATDLTAVESAASREARLQGELDAITIPGPGAGGCDAVGADWLQAYNAAVRAANRAAGVPPASGASSGSD